MRWLLAVTMACLSLTTWAADPVTDATSESGDLVISATPDADAAAADPESGEPIEGRVIRDIDLNLIDLGKLREAVEGLSDPERLRMTLSECVLTALSNNLEVLVTQFEPLKTEMDILAAQGEFDPLYKVSANYLRATQAMSPEYRKFSGIDSTEAYRTTGSTGVGGKLKWGTLYNVQVDMSKEETTFNSFIEEWSGELTLTLSQPLLRGRRSEVNLARIRMAEYGQEAAQEQLRLVVMSTLAEVVKAYWDLVGAIDAVKVRQESLANAERLLDISKKRFDIGTAAAIEVLQAKAGVAVRQSDLISARSQVSNAEDILKHLLDLRDSGYFSNKQIIPTDRPKVAGLDLEELAKSDEALQQSITLALQNRPEMHLGQIEIENSKVDRTRAADALLPEFNLQGSVTQGGRHHFPSDVFEDMYKRTDNAYTVGFTGSVPIGNRTARGSYERSELTVQQSEQRLQKTEQELILKVRMALRALDTSQILVESNRQTRALQETNVVAEEKRLRLGVSTSYRVLDIQEDLTLAQTQELQAQVAYEKALVDLRLAEGTLLESLGVAFAAPTPEKPISYLESITKDALPKRLTRWANDIGDKICPDNEEASDETAASAPAASETPAPAAK